ncbi:MAG: GNAT family N-acetyltransferase [Actinomycetota bacterium]
MPTETPIVVSARHAGESDLIQLDRMYGALADEQSAIREIWPDADGLAPPLDGAFRALIAATDASVVIGEIDGIPVGFLIAMEEPLNAPRDAERIGSIRFIFTDHEARGVGVGAAMLSLAREGLRGAGIRLFDARVSPGHRLAKNFFESHGFKARSITMHSADHTGSGGDAA